mgnify:CR=1 FL=1
MSSKLEATFEKIESALDRFFGKQTEMVENAVEKAFEYTYRETTNGVFGLFDTPEDLTNAAKESVKKGYTNFDCLSPFPIHGMEFAMGLNRSRLPYFVFIMGMLGLLISFLLQFSVHEHVVGVTFSHAFDALPNLNSYAMNFGGKPTFSWPAMMPISFELTVLFAGPIGALIALLALAKLPKSSRKILHPSITDDKFCLWIPSDSANFETEAVKSFMGELGATEITVVKDV